LRTPRSYLNAVLARRGGPSLPELDAIDIETMIYIEDLINTQNYLSARSGMPGLDQQKHGDALRNAYFPFNQHTEAERADRMVKAAKDAQKHSYTIKRGPSGTRLEVT